MTRLRSPVCGVRLRGSNNESELLNESVSTPVNSFMNARGCVAPRGCGMSKFVDAWSPDLIASSLAMNWLANGSPMALGKHQHKPSRHIYIWLHVSVYQCISAFQAEVLFAGRYHAKSWVPPQTSALDWQDVRFRIHFMVHVNPIGLACGQLEPLPCPYVLSI